MPKRFKPIDTQLIQQSAIGMMQDIAGGEAGGFTREPRFRASALPYCPLLFALNDGSDHRRYQSDFYFSTGTAIHELLQTWTSRTKVARKNMFGDWVCTGCKAKKDLRHQPRKLCKCGTPEREWLYSEVQVEWKGFSGHVDTIYRVSRNPDRYAVFDYKTLWFRKGGLAGERVKLPYQYNVLQIEAYCALLREQTFLKYSD